MGMKRQIRTQCRTDKKDVRIDRLIETMGYSLTWISMSPMVAHVTDRKGNPFTLRKLYNFHNYVIEEKNKYNLQEDGTDALVHIAKVERPYIYQACQQIPFSQLLYLSEIKNGKNSTKSMNMKAYLQCGFMICMTWVDNVLKDHYELNLESRIDFQTWMVEWIDSYQKGYLNNDLCNELFIEELGYDMRKGEKVG